MITTAPRYLLELLLIGFMVSLVAITLYLGRDLKVLAPVLVMFGVAALRLLPMVNSFSSGFLQLRFYRNSVAQLYADLHRISNYIGGPQEEARQKGIPPSVQLPLFKSLRLDQVSLQYPGTTNSALSEISLEIHSGESIGLIGASGSGKTTLVDVFLGLLEPQQGSIYYNNLPLSEHLENWRSKVAYLPQDIFITDDTLRRNVALGESETDIDDHKLNLALTNAKLDGLVESLPMGVHTLLGERGMRLSGGQRQRIAIARAFYFAREVLILDEATSALDNETEKEIVDSMLSLKGKTTMIVIAHRLTTVMQCDRIYRLEQGKIVEAGSPQAIL